MKHLIFEIPPRVLLDEFQRCFVSDLVLRGLADDKQHSWNVAAVQTVTRMFPITLFLPLWERLTVLLQIRFDTLELVEEQSESVLWKRVRAWNRQVYRKRMAIGGLSFLLKCDCDCDVGHTGRGIRNATMFTENVFTAILLFSWSHRILLMNPSSYDLEFYCEFEDEGFIVSYYIHCIMLKWRIHWKGGVRCSSFFQNLSRISANFKLYEN